MSARTTSSDQAATRRALCVLEFLECQEVQRVGAAHSALCYFNNLLCNNPCGGVVYHLQAQSIANVL